MAMYSVSAKDQRPRPTAQSTAPPMKITDASMRMGARMRTRLLSSFSRWSTLPPFGPRGALLVAEDRLERRQEARVVELVPQLDRLLREDALAGGEHVG